MASPKQTVAAKVQAQRVALADGKETTVHIVRYEHSDVRPRVALFDSPTRLLDWCKDNGIASAINGGFFGNAMNSAENGAPIGEVWISGVQYAKTLTEFDRGCVGVDSVLGVRIGLRSSFPKEVKGDLLEAGPLLIKDGELALVFNEEGFSSEANLFDNDVTVGRAQRVAVAHNKDSVWFVVSEGRSSDEAGLTLTEMAEFLLGLGATNALNLDGGSGSSLVIDQKLINKPRMGEDRDFQEFPRGREIVTALILG